MKTIPFKSMNRLKILSRFLFCVLVVIGLSACGGGGGGGSDKGEFHLTGYSGVDLEATSNPYELYTEFPWFVNFTFQVSNPECEGVSGLTANDFLVTEDGAELLPADTEMTVRQRHTLPSDYTYTMDTVLLLDNTPSQAGNLDLIKEAAQAVIDSLDERRQQRVAIVAFDENGDPFVKQEFTDNLSALNQCLITGEAAAENEDALQPSNGTTDFYGAVIEGLSLWEDDPSPCLPASEDCEEGIESCCDQAFRQGVLVAITDGKDTANLYDINDATTKRGNKRIYTVGVDSENIPESVQAELEQLGNAGYFPVAEPEREADEGYDKKENLSETLQEIQNKILCFADGFYWLKYKSPSTSTDENLNHNVTVAVVDNKNEGEDATIEGKFSSEDFFTGTAGVYLDASSTDPDGRKEVAITVEEGEINVTEEIKAVAIAENKENASQFEWTSSDESIFTIETRGSSNETGLLTVQDDGEATLTVTDTANGLSTAIRVNILINMDSYEVIQHSADSKPPWFADATFQVRMKEDGDPINNQWTWVPELIREDFSVYENGALVNPDEAEVNLRKRDALPTDFNYTLKTVLLIDNTPSIGSNNLALIKEAARAYVENAFIVEPLLDANEDFQQEIAVWTFTEEGNSSTVWQDFTSDPEILHNAIDNIPPGSGSTNFYGGMIDALNLWENDYNIWQPANKRLQQGLVIAMTDGNHSLPGFLSREAVLTERGNKQVITVGVGDDLVSRVNEDLEIFGNAGFYSIPQPGEEIDALDKDGKEITLKAIILAAKYIHWQIVDYANSFYWLEYKSPAEPAIDCANKETLKVAVNNNANTGAGSFLQGKFESCNFFAPQKNKIYLNSTASDPSGVEGPIEFQLLSLPGTQRLIGEPTYELEAITYEATNTSNYIWEIVSGNNIILEVDEGSYANSRATVSVNPDNRQLGPAWVKIDDKPNSSWTQIKFDVNALELNPIAYYPFNGNANDVTGNGYDGEVKGATSATDRFGEPNKAYAFDGKDDYIALDMFYGADDGSDAWAGENIQEITVGAWVKSSSNKLQFIVSFDRSEYWRFALKDIVGTGNVGWDVANAQGRIKDLATISDYSDGNWHFVVVQYVADGFSKIFVDGQELAAEPVSGSVGTLTDSWGFIGVSSEARRYDGKQKNIGDPNNYNFQGVIDDVIIFHEALSSDRINSLYQGLR